MGYSIYYNAKGFRLKDGAVIPMICAGASNCTQFFRGHEVYEKQWQSFPFDGERLCYTPTELKKAIADEVARFVASGMPEIGNNGHRKFFHSASEYEAFLNRMTHRTVLFDDVGKDNEFALFSDKDGERKMTDNIADEESLRAALSEAGANPCLVLKDRQGRNLVLPRNGWRNV